MAIPLDKIEEAQRFIQALEVELGKAVIGQKRVINEVLIALVAGGHVLLEGVPGLGKTLLVKALAQAFEGEAGRIQFTPDLMPADVIGHTLFDSTTSRFVTRQGPIFANLLLADEINRAPAKTQSALLEAMQEYQVTIEGKAMPLPSPFMVLATQNPIEQEGTYPLPEAQLDRFLLKINIDYPTLEEERTMTRSVTFEQAAQKLDVSPVARIGKLTTILGLQMFASHLLVDDRIIDYAVAIVRATRGASGLRTGAGPRGSIALIRAARARALIAGHDFVTPDDVKSVALAALRHRVVTTADAEIEGRSVDTVLSALLDQVPAPRQ